MHAPRSYTGLCLRQAGILNINCFGLPAVKAVITYKWGVWRRMLHAELACYLVWVLAFQAFVLIFQARRPPPCCLVPGSMSRAHKLTRCVLVCK